MVLLVLLLGLSPQSRAQSQLNSRLCIEHLLGLSGKSRNYAVVGDSHIVSVLPTDHVAILSPGKRVTYLDEHGNCRVGKSDNTTFENVISQGAKILREKSQAAIGKCKVQRKSSGIYLSDCDNEPGESGDLKVQQALNASIREAITACSGASIPELRKLVNPNEGQILQIAPPGAAR